MDVERTLYHFATIVIGECLKASDSGSDVPDLSRFSDPHPTPPHLVKWVKVSAYLIVSAREKSARRSLLDFDREFTDMWVAQLGSGGARTKPWALGTWETGRDKLY